MSQAVATVSDDVETRRVPEPPVWRRWLAGSATWVLLIDIALVVLFTVISPNNVFFSALNARNLLLGGTELLLLTMAIAMLLGGGLLDLSLGANLVLSSVVGALTMQAVLGPAGAASGNAGTAILLGLIACLITGAIFGLVNGFIVAYLEVNSLIGTLGTLGVGTGVALIITRGADIPNLPTELQTQFGLRTIADVVPLPALLAVIIAVVLWAVLRYTRFGLHVLAMGSSRLAVDRAGLNVRRQLLQVAVLAGALAGLAGFVDLSRYLSTSVNGHSQDGLAAITAAVIGGTVLGGGRVSIAGSIWGTVLAQVLLGGLVVIGVASFYQLVVIGAVLIAAVAIDRYRFKQREAR